MIKVLSYNILPIIALFSIKLNADILLYHIAKDIIFIHKAKDWISYFTKHLQYLTNDNYIKKIINCIIKILENNQFYFCLLNQTNENMNREVYFIGKDKHFIDLFELKGFLKQNIFDRNLSFLPVEKLECYYTSNLKNKINPNKIYDIVTNKPNHFYAKDNFKIFSQYQK